MHQGGRMPQDLIASKDVCLRLGKDRSTLSRWVAAGRIKPAYQLPGEKGAFLFAASDVERLERELLGAA